MSSNFYAKAQCVSFYHKILVNLRLKIQLIARLKLAKTYIVPEDTKVNYNMQSEAAGDCLAKTVSIGKMTSRITMYLCDGVNS